MILSDQEIVACRTFLETLKRLYNKQLDKLQVENEMLHVKVYEQNKTIVALRKQLRLDQGGKRNG